VRSGKLEQHLKPLAARLHEQGKLNLDEGYVDATFRERQNRGGFAVALPATKSAQRLSLLPPTTVFLSPYPSKALSLPSASLC
jgi:hypothetical protein